MATIDNLFEIRKMLSDITSKDISVPDNELENTHIMEDMNLDSLDVINFLFRMEEKTSVKIPEEDIDTENLMIVGNLVSYLKKRQ